MHVKSEAFLLFYYIFHLNFLFVTEKLFILCYFLKVIVKFRNSLELLMNGNQGCSIMSRFSIFRKGINCCYNVYFGHQIVVTLYISIRL